MGTINKSTTEINALLNEVALDMTNAEVIAGTSTAQKSVSAAQLKLAVDTHGASGGTGTGITAETQAALDLKADAAATTASLALKADASAVTASLALKADASATTASLALKADASALPAAQTDPVIVTGTETVQKTVSAAQLRLAAQTHSYKSFVDMAAFTTAGGAAGNPGPVWIDGVLYWSDGVTISASGGAGGGSGGSVLYPTNGKDYLPRLTNRISLSQSAFGVANAASTWNGDWSAPFLSGGATRTFSTTTFTDDTVTLDVPIGGRAFFSRAADHLVVGRTYALSINITVNSGTPLPADIINYTGTATGTVTLSPATSGRYVIIFTPTVTTAGRLIRFGLGNNGALTAAGNITLRAPMLEDITDNPTRFSDYTPRDRVIWNAPNNSVGAANIVVQATGAVTTIQPNRVNYVLVQGDSYSNDNADFPNLLNNLGEIVVRSVGVSGATIHGVLEPAFAAGLAADYYDCVILQGGVNDINTSVTLANLKTAQISRIEKSLAAGCHLIVLDVAPYITFNTNPVKLLMWEQYNTWLENYCVSNGITLLKISNLLADPTNRYVINPIYQVSGESPNFLHVNEAGALAIANAIYSELLAINAG